MLSDASTELRTTKPSLAMRAVKWVMARRKPVFPHTPEEFRKYIAARKLPRDAPMPGKFDRKFQVRHWEAAGQPVVTLHPRSGPARWHMLYFHGGGFILPTFSVHWPLAAALVEQAGVSITMPLYDVVPEAPYSNADEQADEVFERLCESHDPARIALCGDSAGGHMALSLALRLAKAGKAQAGKLALFAPWLDVTLQDKVIEAVEPHDIMLKIDTLRSCGELFAGDRDPASPECSPLFTSKEHLAQLPPTRIWTGRHDLFIVDSRTFVTKLRDAGVDAKLYEYEAAPHVYMAVTPTRESKDTLARLRDFLGH